ncbi:PAS domain-containing sensor histidine kinase [Bartonella sp. F02]|uniref:PAS domain-containing sensor histidine kinase n=1 Tax=Bartonella sp. F02 TaxID=2967262 RepID=UPI0022A96D1A|nr:ATP-binding protein [Bartonella sp. F02]MCZ2328907.1 ATP-binding protein [Bartonella sp. F02]
MPLTFLDYLECKEIKQAFIRGQMAFVLSSDGKNILWSNGAAAYFFGFSSVEDATSQHGFFDQEVSYKILKSAQSSRFIMLNGVKYCAEFSIFSVNISRIGQVFLLEAILTEHISIIAGLDNATRSVAVIDADAIILESSSHFDCVDETVKILLQTINDDSPVKTVLSVENGNIHVGVIRLEVNPENFLILCVQLNKEQLIKQKRSFSFSSKLLPRRFIWTMDADGYFCDVSEELYETVGPISSHIVGADFDQLAKQFNDERYRTLSSFIKSTIPWSAQKVEWPIDGCSDKLDVELSALPIFDLGHRLKGFRGFGILKLREKVQDTQDAKRSVNTSTLSEVECLAFREIAERLRSELHSSLEEESVVEDMSVQLPLTQPSASVNVIEHVSMKEPSAILSLLDTVTDGVLCIDEQRLVQFVSNSALALMNYEINELLAQPLLSFFTVQSRVLIEEYFERTRATRKIQIFNCHESVDLVTKNNDTLAISMMIVPLIQQGHYAVVLRNMMEVAYSFDNAGKENKIARAVDEIQTFLNMLIDFAENTRDGQFSHVKNERYYEDLSHIISFGKQILSLMYQLSEYSKMNDAGIKSRVNTSLITQEFDVISHLRTNIAFFETQANHNGIIMRIVAPVHVPFIRISPQVFRQVIWSLLFNAIHFTPSGGQIVIHVFYGKGQCVKISVSDNGVGMSEKEIAWIMQPYDPIECTDDQCYERVLKETGLGLAMCKTMVEENGGQFLLFSKPHHGTTVEMFFPVFRE